MSYWHVQREAEEWLRRADGVKWGLIRTEKDKKLQRKKTKELALRKRVRRVREEKHKQKFTNTS